jgi:tripartite-type tricarboxylate transporter receptor subunit TctC
MQRTKRMSLLLGVALSFFVSAVAPTMAQTYPTRPVRIVVPFGAGGGTDNLARIAEPYVSRALGQSIIIDNRPGGGSVIGTDTVAKSASDGYTVLMTDSSIAVNPSLLKNLPYDTLRDLEPVSLLAAAPVILVAHTQIGATTLREFVSLAKAQPGKFNYASGGNGSSTHLGGELLKLVAGIDLIHIAYKGTGPAINDLIGGHVDVMFSGISSARPQLDAGALRGFAVTGEQRNSAVPNVPTFTEQGFPDVTASTYWGVLAPKGTPMEIIDRLSATFATAMRDREIIARLALLGYVPLGGGPSDYAANLRSEIRKWNDVITRARIRIE